MSWEMVNITDVLFFQEGPGVRNTQFTSKGVKLLNVGNINNGVVDLDSTTVHISEDEAYGKYSHFLVDEGDLLIASSGIVVDNFHNKIAWAKAEHLPLCMNTSTIRFKSLDNKVLDLKYFSYYLKTRHFSDQLRRLITGSAQLNFGPSHLKQIKFPLPPLPIQKRIAEILDAADALRKKDQELLKKYDELAQSIFIDMFGDPVKNEKGWDVKLLEEVIEMKGGGTPNTKRDDYYNGEIPWVSPKDMKSTYIQNSIDTISELAVQESSTNMIPENSVLMVVRSGILKKTLPVAINTVPVAINQDMKAFLPTKYFTAEFLLYFLKVYESQILQTVRGTTADNISSDVIKNINLFLPPIARQNKFSSAVKSLFLAKDSIEKSTTELLFSSLISKAFSGELVS